MYSRVMYKGKHRPDNAGPIRVISVETIDTDEQVTVYDAEVEIDESFSCYGVVLHNSPICIQLDGKVYQADDPAIRWQPLHWGCRSTMIPITKSWRELGIDRDDIPPDTRASMNGQVPADMDYGDWLRRQSAEVQDEVLGKTRGKAFREGNLPISRFIDDKGRWYTLDELRAADKI